MLPGSAGEWSSRTALCAVVADPVWIGGTQLPQTTPDRDFVGEIVQPVSTRRPECSVFSVVVVDWKPIEHGKDQLTA